MGELEAVQHSETGPGRAARAANWSLTWLPLRRLRGKGWTYHLLPWLVPAGLFGA